MKTILKIWDHLPILFWIWVGVFLAPVILALAQSPIPSASPIPAVEAAKGWIDGSLTSVLASLSGALIVLLAVAKSISNEKAQAAVGVLGKIKRGLIWLNDTIWSSLSIANYVVQVLSSGLVKLIAFLDDLTSSDGIGGKK